MFFVDNSNKNQHFLINETDAGMMYQETDTKRFDIISDIDNWEYKNITEKFLKKGIYTSVPSLDADGQDSSNPGVAGLNPTILNSADAAAFRKRQTKKRLDDEAAGKGLSRIDADLNENLQ